MFSFQRHNKRQYEINANSLKSSYARLYHTAAPRAILGNTKFPHPDIDDTPEYYYKQSDNRDVITNSLIPDETEPSGTYFLFT